MAKSTHNTRTVNTDGTTTIEVQTNVTVWITVPSEHADDLSAWDFQDQIDYLVSEAAENVVDTDLDPVTIPLFDEDGMEETGEAEITATITGVGY